MKVRCPRCRQETSFEDNPFRPFCSERCKLIDLGKWISGSYRVTEREEEREKEETEKTEGDADSS
jgi:hypothetical protein